MKISDIEVGYFYHDNKDGVREVLDITRHHGGVIKVHYKILHSKINQSYSAKAGRVVATTQLDYTCNLQSFANWSKLKMGNEECQALLIEMKAKKIKLTSKLIAFIEKLSKLFSELHPPKIGFEIKFSPEQYHSVKALYQRGLLAFNPKSRKGGSFTIEPLGAYLIQQYL